LKKTSEALGISRSTLYRKLKEYGLNKNSWSILTHCMGNVFYFETLLSKWYMFYSQNRKKALVININRMFLTGLQYK
jgi:AraC-like DNA-binding protein